MTVANPALQMMNIDGELKLLTAVFELLPPPCEKFKCSFVSKCAQGKLACDAYLSYVQNGMSFQPSGLPARRKYALLFPERPV